MLWLFLKILKKKRDYEKIHTEFSCELRNTVFKYECLFKVKIKIQNHVRIILFNHNHFIKLQTTMPENINTMRLTDFL